MSQDKVLTIRPHNFLTCQTSYFSCLFQFCISEWVFEFSSSLTCSWLQTPGVMKPCTYTLKTYFIFYTSVQFELRSACTAGVFSLSLAVTYWKERSSEGKVVRQEQLLAVVEVVVNSLRRYLKSSLVSSIQSPVSWPFACCLGQRFCARGARQ